VVDGVPINAADFGAENVMGFEKLLQGISPTQLVSLLVKMIFQRRKLEPVNEFFFWWQLNHFLANHFLANHFLAPIFWRKRKAQVI